MDVFDGLFSDKILKTVLDKYATQDFKYGWKAANKEMIDQGYDQGHWNNYITPMPMSFMENAPFDLSLMRSFRNKHPELLAMWTRMKDVIPEPESRGISRIYVNGYTYGTDGYVHTDDQWIHRRYRETTETCLVYLNDVWDYQWAGETVCLDAETEEINKAVLPKWGRLFAFDSHVLHGARPVSRICKRLRTIIVFKTMTKNIYHEGLVYLMENGLDDIQFGEESLFQHLYDVGLHAAEKYDADSSLLNCMFFYPIYNIPNVVNPSRKEVKSIIGDLPEQVIHVYCGYKGDSKAILNRSNDDFKRYLVLIDLCRLEVAEPDNEYIEPLRKTLIENNWLPEEKN